MKISEIPNTANIGVVCMNDYFGDHEPDVTNYTYDEFVEYVFEASNEYAECENREPFTDIEEAFAYIAPTCDGDHSYIHLAFVNGEFIVIDTPCGNCEEEEEDEEEDEG